MTDHPDQTPELRTRNGGGRFFVGLAGVTLIVTYLIWTGVSETMVYYLTPTELIERVEADPTFREMGVKISGRLILDSHERLGMNEHRFRITDLEDPETVITIEYNDALPDTFNDQMPDVEVIAEGRLNSDGVFEATLVLTKCGSRYEAAPEGHEEGTGYDADHTSATEQTSE